MQITRYECCSVMQCGAVCCSVLQCVAVCCSVLQCVTDICRLHIDCRKYIDICVYIQPIPLGVTFSNAVSKLKAQSSNVSFATFQ